MPFRVSDQEVYRTVLNNLFASTRRLSQTQAHVSSGRRIVRPSDDPSGTAKALAHRTDLARNAQHQRAVTDALARLGATEAALSTATGMLQRARELSIAAGSPVISAEQLQQLGTEVNQILEGMLQTANANFAGAFLFSGQQTMTAAFSATKVGGLITAVTYQGDTGALTREVGVGVRIDINVTGDAFFQDALDSLIRLRDALNAGDAEAAMAELPSIDAASNSLLNARGQIGALTNAVEATQARLLEENVRLRTQQSEIEEVDMAEVVVQLTTQENIYQAALATAARVIQPSLLDFLR